MNRGEFTRDVLKKLKAPITPGRLYFGVAWAASEEKNNEGPRNNPWCTTEPYPDATDYNDEGVKNYKTYEDGVYATVSTLLNGNYKELVDALKDEKAKIGNIIVALNGSSWGSHVSLSLFSDVMDHYDEYNSEVVGSESHSTAFAPALAPEADENYSNEPTREDVVGKQDEDETTESENEVSDENIPTEDTLEDRLKKLYGDVKTDVEQVEAKVETVAADVPEEVDSLEDRLKKLNETPVVQTVEKDVEQVLPVGVSDNLESRVARLEKFVSGVLEVVTKL